VSFLWPGKGIDHSSRHRGGKVGEIKRGIYLVIVGHGGVVVSIGATTQRGGQPVPYSKSRGTAWLTAQEDKARGGVRGGGLLFRWRDQVTSKHAEGRNKHKSRSVQQGGRSCGKVDFKSSGGYKFQ